ncbi:hypothetical protein [Stieleria sp.]
MHHDTATRVAPQPLSSEVRCREADILYDLDGVFDIADWMISLPE